MTAPTLIAYAETTWTASGGLSTPSVSWQAGDVIVVIGGDENSASLAAPTATGLTFTALLGSQLGTKNASCGAQAWSATASASGSSAVSVGASGSDQHGAGVWVWRGSGGTGNTGSDVSAALTASLTRSGADSCVVGACFDWDATSPTGYGWTPAVADDRDHAQSGTHWTYYVADWGGQGAAGTTSYGLTGVSGQFTKLFVEILGAASGGSETGTLAAALPAPTASFAGAVAHTGTLSATLPAPAASLAGTVTHTGSLAAALPAVEVAFSGTVGAAGVTGSFAAALPALSAAFAGTLTHTGTLAAALPALSASLAGPGATGPFTVGALTAAAAAGAGAAGDTAFAALTAAASAAATLTARDQPFATLTGRTG